MDEQGRRTAVAEGISIEHAWRAGRRIYVRSRYGSPLAEALKSAGARWDPEEKCWWLGMSKRDVALELIREQDARVQAAKAARAAAAWSIGIPAWDLDTRERLKALGARWDPEQKRWWGGTDTAKQAKEIVQEAQAARRAKEEAREARKWLPREAVAEPPAEVQDTWTTLELEVPDLGSPQRRGLTTRVPIGTRGTRMISEDDPSIYGSHLLGYEGWEATVVVWRHATSEELQALEDREAAKEVARVRRVQLYRERSALSKTFTTDGTCPAGPLVLDGEIVASTQTLAGTGDWFVLDPEGGRMWWVRNNGAPGDNWNLNNIRTQGAGAIGWELPWDDALAQRIRALEPAGTRADETQVVEGL